MTTIVSSSLQTKNWRNSQSWYNNGKKNECEKYQKQMLFNINSEYSIEFCDKSTYKRLNYRTCELKKLAVVDKEEDKFEWTEDFDCSGKFKDIVILYNLKMVCDKGGAQTRTLREVYHFIKMQINYLERNENIIFVNILDGDECSRNQTQLKYLYNKCDEKMKSRLFIGDLQSYHQWIKTYVEEN